MSSIPQVAVKENGVVSFPYPMLSPHNYIVWAIKTEVILDAQGVWEEVESVEGAQVDAKKDKKAHAYILQCAPEDILLQIAKRKTAKEVWDNLKTRYLGSDRVKKARVQTLKSEFDALRMKETDTIDEFAGKLSAMSSKFSALGATLEDSSLVKKLLDSVPDKFFPIVAGIEQFHDLETIPFEETIGRLKAYQERTLRLRGNTNSTEGELLLTHAEWQMRQKGGNVDTSSGGKGRGSSNPSRSKWRGHRRGRGRGRGTPSQDSAGGTSSNGRGTRDKSRIKCFTCEKMGHYASECYNKRRDDETHLTCATDEEPALMMTVPHEESDTRRERQDTILLSEDRLLPEMYRDINKGDKDVWYLDNETGNEVYMEKDIMKVIDRSGKLLMLLLGEKKLAVDVPPLPQPNKLCEVCVIAKHARSLFPCQANFRAKKPLELLHADICGPISPYTLAGNKYFLLIVDDFTRWMWVFILAAKNDAFRAFKKFKFLTENKTEYKIKTLRTDRGGEFLSTEFTQFCEDEGIE
ncbi:uncharacterized protein LOC122031635 [Zingiber officinale]|uniref:uncharacterized protein LOC122031635 n=1 Tax=Zingiber officinale TaxID=94328 RepID=UPI001C4AD8BE|nr:uncharacterized protein LOC122031635 [Zingiber officinale]